MSEQPPTTGLQEVNPLQKKLSPEQFEASVKFYEADHKLTPQDREELRDDLSLVVAAASTAGYGSGIGLLFAPTIFDQLKKRREGLKPRFVFKSPFFSLFIGFGAVIASHQVVCSYMFNKKLNEIENNSVKVNQYQVWKTMDYHQATLFYLYYRQSAHDKLFILKDPRSYTEHEVQYHPPASNSNSLWGPFSGGAGSNQHFADAMGMGLQGSHWDTIRKENGIEAPIPANDSPVDGSNASDKSESELFNHGSSNSDDESASGSKEYKSAWDKIRGK